MSLKSKVLNYVERRKQLRNLWIVALCIAVIIIGCCIGCTASGRGKEMPKQMPGESHEDYQAMLFREDWL